MGIDAEILIRRVPRKIVTDDWLAEKSWRLCASIGHEHFFITDGLPPAEFEVKSKAWHAAFEAHPLYPEMDKARRVNFNDPGYVAASEKWRAIGAQIRATIGPAPEVRRLAIERTLTRYREDDDPPPGSEYREDSDKPIKAQGDECLLELSLWGRYYGEGYERGNILIYCAIAEWLEQNIRGCEVWYGGDSSGVCAKPFTDAMRRKLRRHLYSQHGRDYFNHEGMSGGFPALPPACSMCPGGIYRGSQCMWGGGLNNVTTAGFYCRGCGKGKETHDGGQTWVARKED